MDGSALSLPVLHAVGPSGSGVYEGTFTTEIETAGEVDTYTFDLDVGARIAFFADADSTLRARLNLRGPDNAIVGSVSASAPGGDITLQTSAVTVAGTYTLSVDGLSGTRGHATIRTLLGAVIEPEAPGKFTNNSIGTAVNLGDFLQPLPGGGTHVSVVGTVDKVTSPLPAEIESNNTIALANSAAGNFVAAPDNLFHLNLRGTVNSGTDVDVFAIGSLQAGDVITIAHSGSASLRGTLFDPRFTLYRGSTGAPVSVTSDDNSGPGLDALRYRFTISDTDTYYIAASSVAGDTGTYDLSLRLENTGAAPQTGGTFLTEVEGNDTPATANNATASWRKIQYLSRTSASLSSSTDVDYYRYEFQAGDLVTVNLDSASQVDLRASIFNAVGTEIAREDGSSSGPGTDSQIYSFRIPSSGTYYVRASTVTGPGSYQADVYLSTVTPLPAPVVPEDFYSVTLAAGERASFAIDAVTGGPVTLELQDDNGTLLAMGVADANGGVSIQGFTPAEAGRYYLRVTGLSGSEYNLLTVRGVDLESEGNNTFDTAQPLGLSGEVLGRAGLPDPSRVFVYDSVANLIREINPQTGSTLRSFPSPVAEVGATVGDLALANTGTSLLVAGALGAIHELDLNTGATLRTISNNSNITGLAFLDGTIYATASSSFGSPSLRAFDYSTGLPKALPFGSGNFFGAGSDGLTAGNGFLLAIDSWDGLHQVDVSSGTITTLGTLPGVGSAAGLGVSGRELFVADGSEIEVYDLSSLTPVRTLTGFAGLTAIGADDNAVRDVDYFQVHAVEGATLKIHTTTPGAPASGTAFDPFVVLYDASGQIVASDNNSAPDGRNASLTYTVSATGTYTVYVRGMTLAAGDYVLTVEGADTTQQPFGVASVTPASGSLLTSAPATVRLNFDASLLLPSLQASDFLLNGNPVTGFTMIDGDTVEIALPAGLGHGTHTVSIAGGALTSVSGLPVEAYSGTFTVDLQAPRVTSVDVQKGEILTPGDRTFTIGFNEAMKTSVINTGDVTLVNSSSGKTYIPTLTFNEAGDVLTLSFSSLPEGNYQLTLLSQSFGFTDRAGRTLDGEALSWPIPGNVSGDGTAGGNFVLDFTVDADGAQPLPSFTPIGLPGAQVYGSSETYSISAADDSDEFTVTVAPGQALTLIARPGGGLKPVVTVLDADGNPVATTTGPLAGREALVHLPSTSAGGSYTVRLSGADGTTGAATLEAFLNTGWEMEGRTGAANNSLATAENIDAAFVALPNGGKMAALGGVTDQGDFYALTLAAGEKVAFAVGTAGSKSLELVLQDANGTSLAVGRRNELNSGVVIEQFTAPADGTYYVRVVGDNGATYQLAAVRDARWEGDGNDSLERAQDLGGEGRVVGYTGYSVLNRLFVYELFDETISELNRETGATIRSFSVPGEYTGSIAGMATTGRTLLFGAGLGGLVYELHPDTGEVLRTIETPANYISGLAFMGDEIFVLTSFWSGEIAVLDYETGALKRTIVASGVTEGLASADGVLLGSGFNDLYEINALTGSTVLKKKFDHPSDGLGVIGDELYVGSIFGTEIYHYPTLEHVRTLDTSVDASAVGADAGGSFRGDFFRISAVAGANLTLTTATPGESLNGLNPAIDLYDAAGNLIASNDNGAADGRNATLTFTVPAGGDYYVQVRAVGGTRGEYVLNVDGATEPVPEFNVTGVSLPNGTKLTSAPTAVRVDFDQLVNPASLQAADLMIGGRAATSVRLLDGNTAEFTVPAGLAGGVHSLALSAGAVTNLDGVPLAEFTSQFEIDVTAPRIVGVSLQDGATGSAEKLVYVLEFSEPMKTANLSYDDISLERQQSGFSYSPSKYSYDATGRFLTLEWNLLPEGDYTLTLVSGAEGFQNQVGLSLDGEHSGPVSAEFPTGDGSPGGDFDTTVTLDRQAPVTLVPKNLGVGSSLLARASTSSYLTQGDSDTYIVNLEAGESLAAFVDPAATLMAGVVIRDPQGNVVGEYLGGATDQAILIPTYIAQSAGAYSVTISALGETSGAVSLSVTQNGVLESENHGGAVNDTLATAQDLSGAWIDLAGNSRQVSVLGGAGGDDWYHFDLVAGETLAFAIDNTGTQFLQQSALSLTDENGNVLVSAAAGFYLDRVVHGFTAPATGTYYLQVAGPSSGNYQLVASVNLDIHDSSITSPGQALGEATSVIGSLSGSSGLFAYGVLSREIVKLSPTDLYSYLGYFRAPVQGDVGNDVGMAFTGRTLLFATRGASAIQELDATTGAVLREIPVSVLNATGLAYNDGEIFVLSDAGFGEITVLDYATGAVKRTIFADVALEENLAATPTHLISVRGNTVYQIDPETGLTRTLGKVEVPSNLASSGDTVRVDGLGILGGKLYVAFESSSPYSFRGRELSVYDLDTLELLRLSSSFSFDSLGAISGDSQEPVPHLFTVQAPEAGSTLQISALIPGARGTFAPRLELLDSTGAVVASDVTSDGHDAMLTYTAPAAGTFTVRISAAAGQGQYLLQVLGTNPGNDAPIITSDDVPSLPDLLEDQASIPGTRVVDLLGLGTADPAVIDLDANALPGIAVTSVDDTHGTWQYSLDGEAWLPIGNVSADSARLLDGNAFVRFVPAADFNGSAEFSYRAWDQTSGISGTTADTTLNGGSTAFSVDVASASVAVLAVDDAPAILNPGVQVTREDAPLIFSSSSGNQITLVDSDGGSPLVSVSISTAQGAVTLSTMTGLTFTQGDGTSDGSMVFSGSVAAINAALEGLIFTPTAEFAGEAEIAIALREPGQSPGEPPVTSISVPVKVTPVLEFTGSITYTDADGDRVKVVLRGGGRGEIWLSDLGDSDAAAIVLDGTRASSTLTITTPRGTETVVREILVNGSLKSLTGSTTDLAGTLQVTGAIRSVILDDVNGSSIGLHTDTNVTLPKKSAVSLKFDRVSDTNLTSNGLPIASLKVTEWLNTDLERERIEAPSLGTLTVSGHRKQLVAGDLGADLSVAGGIKKISVAGNASGDIESRTIGSLKVGGNLTNAEIVLSEPVHPTKATRLALGSLNVGGSMTNSVLESVGRIGAITLRGMHDSRILAGVASGSTSLPDSSEDFVANASIRSVSLVGATAEFSNSLLASSSINSLSLRGVKPENGGIPFGIAADRIAALVVKHSEGTMRYRKLINPEQSLDDEDFLVRVV